MLLLFFTSFLHLDFQIGFTKHSLVVSESASTVSLCVSMTNNATVLDEAIFIFLTAEAVPESAGT